MFFGKVGERRFKFRAGYICCFAALLALGMMVVRGENFTKLNLMFEAVPNTVYDAKFFVKLDSPVDCGAVNLFLQFCRKVAYADRATRCQMCEDCYSTFRSTIFSFFKRCFNFL